MSMHRGCDRVFDHIGLLYIHYHTSSQFLKGDRSCFVYYNLSHSPGSSFRVNLEIVLERRLGLRLS
jgi:hypothetical protein